MLGGQRENALLTRRPYTGGGAQGKRAGTMNENHFGDRVRQQLNLGLRMDDAILRRLRTGRELALERRRVANTAPIAALADNVLGRLGMPETLLRACCCRLCCWLSAPSPSIAGSRRSWP